MVSEANGSSQFGFTLLELMIVVAVIGLLMAIGIPQYQQYSIRAKVSEGLSLADAAKTAVADAYASLAGSSIAAYGANCPAITPDGFGYTCSPVPGGAASTNVTYISIAAIPTTPVAPTLGTATNAGMITIAFAAASGAPPGMLIHLTPGSGAVAGGVPQGALSPSSPVVWGCDTDSVAANYPYVPAECRN